jgi:hypothetical protein
MTKFAVAILLALTMPAGAADMASANFFLPGCKGFLVPESTTTLMQGRCLGVIEGLAYGVGGQEICQPKGGEAGQAVAVVIKYIEARPERMHEPFAKLALEALTAAWPCKR